MHRSYFLLYYKTILFYCYTEIVFRNYVPNKYITIDDKDPVWMNETVKLKIKTKNNMYNKYIQNGRFESDFLLLETLITELNELMNTTKALYYQNLSKKLNNPLL